MKKISIQELKRLAGDELTEEEYEKIAQKVMGRTAISHLHTTRNYDEVNEELTTVTTSISLTVLDFEFLTVDTMFFEEKVSRFGNKGFYYKGFSYKEKNEQRFERVPQK